SIKCVPTPLRDCSLLFQCTCFHWFERVHVTFSAWKKIDHLKRVRTAA
ncbi:Uncharacterized protein APZ42_003856, partial [Daphnia magna]